MRCFVIGPIGDQLADHGSEERRLYEEALEVYDEVIKAACSTFSIETYRSDEISEPGDINEQIFTAIRDAEIVIADLTGANPNVMYELGLRHLTGQCTVSIGEKGRLPFDVSTIRTILFKRSATGLVTGRKRLVKALESALSNGCPLSPAGRVIGLAVRSDEPLAIAIAADGDNGVTTIGDPSDQEDLEEPMGMLDAAVEIEDGLPDFTEKLSSQTATIQQITQLTAVYAERLQRSQKSGQKLALVGTYSKELKPLVTVFDDQSLELDARVSSLSLAVDVVLNHLEAGNELEGSDGLLASISGMADAAREARDDGITGFLNSLGGVEDAARQLRPVIALLRTSLERTVESFTKVVGWGERASSILGPSCGSSQAD